MIYVHDNIKYDINRYPSTKHNSLKGWNAADEYIIKFLSEITLYNKKLMVYNDRFGFLGTVLADYNPTAVICYKSQGLSYIKNFEDNFINTDKIKMVNLLDDCDQKIDVAMIKVPKSIELFKLYLQHLSKHITKESVVVCGFMTKYFNRQMLTVASEYFEDVSQSLAWKKSRLLHLKNPKKHKEIEIINKISVNETVTIQQYFGVFSSDKIDPATKFLIENIKFSGSNKKILDLGAGNGILTRMIADKNPGNEYYLIDDSLLAIESAKLNLQGANYYFYYNDELSDFNNQFFDFVISNPPFHFEHEINIEISLELFRQVYRCLKEGGEFQLVANKHLNYKTHLVKHFHEVDVIAETSKYIIYLCRKLEAKENASKNVDYNIKNLDSSE